MLFGQEKDKCKINELPNELIYEISKYMDKDLLLNFRLHDKDRNKFFTSLINDRKYLKKMVIYPGARECEKSRQYFPAPPSSPNRY